MKTILCYLLLLSFIGMYCSCQNNIQEVNLEELSLKIKADTIYYEFIKTHEARKILIANTEYSLSKFQEVLDEKGLSPCDPKLDISNLFSVDATTQYNKYLDLLCKNLNASKYLYSTYPELQLLEKGDKLRLLFPKRQEKFKELERLNKLLKESK